jgi:solute carrier family 7 (L-type amino acid transporter), member 9/15
LSLRNFLITKLYDNLFHFSLNNPFSSTTGALAYAELGTMNTSSGAEWAYFMDAFGSAPAFIFSWVSTLVLKPSQMAIICLSFAQYAVEAFVSECNPPSIVVKMVGLLAIGEKILSFCQLISNVFPSFQSAFCLLIVIASTWEWLYKTFSLQQSWLLS